MKLLRIFGEQRKLPLSSQRLNPKSKWSEAHTAWHASAECTHSILYIRFFGISDFFARCSNYKFWAILNQWTNLEAIRATSEYDTTWNLNSLKYVATNNNRKKFQLSLKATTLFSQLLLVLAHTCAHYFTFSEWLNRLSELLSLILITMSLTIIRMFAMTVSDSSDFLFAEKIFKSCVVLCALFTKLIVYAMT